MQGVRGRVIMIKCEQSDENDADVGRKDSEEHVDVMSIHNLGVGSLCTVSYTHLTLPTKA